VAELFPTKTRLALLQAVAEGDVLVDAYGQALDPSGFRLTSRWIEARHAGWVLRPNHPRDEDRWIPGQLTDAGRAVLDGRKA